MLEAGPLEDRCRHEIEELHQFFQDWFRGDVPNSNEQFDRFASSLAPGFRIVSPDGECLERATILQMVRERYEKTTDLKMEIRKVQLCHCRHGVAVVMYEEWQSFGTSEHGRLSTAILELEPQEPDHVCWWHVHETWID